MSCKEKDKPSRLELKSTGNEDFEQFFELFLGGAHRPPFMPAEDGWRPAADLYETEDRVVIVIDIAGIDIADIDLVLDKETLQLKGIRRETPGQERRQYHNMEVSYGPFQRNFRLPSPVCADKVTANYAHGLLSISLLKRPKPLNRKVKIHVK